MDAQEMVTHLVDEFGDWIDGDDPVDWAGHDIRNRSPRPVAYDDHAAYVRFESGAKLKITVESYEGEKV